MAAFSTLGIGSGLDLGNLVSQLVAVEGQATSRRLNRQEAEYQAKLSAMGTLKGALSGFQSSLSKLQNIANFQNKSVTTASETDLFTVSSSSNAALGTYGIEIIDVARAHTITTETTDVTKMFATAEDTLGSGTLTFQFGTISGSTFSVNPDKATQTVTISTTDNTVTGVRDAINKADIGVSASIINNGTGYVLSLVSTDTGANNALKVTVVDDDGNDTDSGLLNGLSQLTFDPAGVTNLSTAQAGADTEVVLNGITIKSASNTITDAIEGVTLNVKNAKSGETVTVTVAEDKESAETAIRDFVKSFNSLNTTIDTLTKSSAEVNERGILASDASTRSIENQLRRLLTGPVNGLTGSIRALSDMGITTDINGTLKIDETKFGDALEKNYEGVTRLFADVGQPTDSLIGFVSSTDSTKIGNYAVNISTLSTQGKFTGAAVTISNLVIDSNNDNFRIKVDGVESATISLTQSTFATGADLASELQSRINGDSALQAAGVSVSVTYNASNQFEISSARYGTASKVEITSIDTNTTTQLGLSVGSGTVGVDVAGTIGNGDGTGNAQTLTGTGGALGLAIKITGGSTGDRGSVDYSVGLSKLFDDLLEGLLKSDGPLNFRTDSLNDQIEDISDRRDTLARRLESFEERLVKQFSALDILVSNLRATGDFLTRQLDAIAKLTLKR